MSIPHQIYVIQRKPPQKCVSRKYEEHREVVAKRRRRVQEIYSSIEKILRSFPKVKKRSELLIIASAFSHKLNIKIDRDAKRLNECLICWYCENWHLIKSILVPTYHELYFSGAFNIISPNFDIDVFESDLGTFINKFDDLNIRPFENPEYECKIPEILDEPL